MRKIPIVLILAALLPLQSVFAHHMYLKSKPCAKIAAACLKAGFGQKENAHQRFWQDCMKPIILGHTVKGVTVSPVVVKQCRTDKINRLKKELVEFEKVSS